MNSNGVALVVVFAIPWMIKFPDTLATEIGVALRLRYDGNL